MSSVIIYDTSLNKVAHVPLAFDIGYHMRANEVGQAWFSVPTDDPHIAEIQEMRFAEIYDGDDRVELFRILTSWKGQKDGEDFQRFACEHALGTLNDDEFDDLFNVGAVAGTAAALTNILAEQGTGRWQLGTCAFSEDYLYGWKRGTKLLKAVLDVPGRFQKGYFFTYDTSSYPWTLNLIEPPATVTAYVDYGRNMKAIERRKDTTGLVTKLYPYGAYAGEDQIDITSEEPSSHAYITNNTATYGTIVHHWTDQRYETAAELYAAAQEYLAVISEPKYTYLIDLADLYRLTGESIDAFTMGALVRVDNPEVDITTEVRVMEIRKSDITGKPGEVSLTFANKGEEFDFSEKLKSNDLSGVDIINIPGGRIGGIPTPPSDAGLYITSSYLGYHDGSDWKTYMDDAGRIYAQHADAYFFFNPVVGTLSIKCTSLNIDAAVNVVGESQIKNLAVTNAKIASLSIDKLTAGTLDAVTVTLANTGCIRLGKTGPSDTDEGFWLGEAAGAAMFSIGSASTYLKWTGTQLLIVGELAGVLSSSLNMNGNDFYNCGAVLGGGLETTTSAVNVSGNAWVGADVDTLLSLAATGSLEWSAAGTVSAGTDLNLTASGGDLYLTASSQIKLQVFGGTVLTINSITATDSTTLAVGHEGLITCDVGGVTRYLAFREAA